MIDLQTTIILTLVSFIIGLLTGIRLLRSH